MRVARSAANHRPRRAPAARCAALALLVNLACSFNAPASPPAPTRPIEHVLLISIDTCRADYLGCYGRGDAATPHIDALAAGGCLFLNALSPAPLTLPAHCSLLTGTIPPQHGVRDNSDYRLAAAVETLAEVLKRQGFATGAVVSAFVLDSKFGLDQGFDDYQDRFLRELKAGEMIERRGDEATDVALEWIADHKDRRWFLFLHYYDPHYPYEPPEPFDQRFKDNPYAGEIAFVDQGIGRVVQRLRDTGLYDTTLIVVAGDHGEMLGEHGESTHGYFVYQAALRVPLVIMAPGGRAGQRVAAPVGLVDVAPTICGLLGVAPPTQARGVDLSACVKGELADPDRAIYSESLTPTKHGANPLWALVTQRWKLIRTTRPELYDLRNDPREATNLAERHTDTLRELEAQLARIAEAQPAPAGQSRATTDAGDRRRLEALGYVGGNVSDASFELDPRRADPKDLIAFHELRSKLSLLVHRADFAEAERLCAEMVQQHPQQPEGYVAQATIALEQRDLAAALPPLQRALELRPDHAVANNMLGAVLVRCGRAAEAVQHFRRVLERDADARQPPDLLAAHFGLGEAAEAQGQLKEAVAHFRAALPLDPDAARILRRLARALAALGRPDEAAQALEQAVQSDSDAADARRELAALRMRQGRLDEAIEQYRKLLAAQPDDASARYNLGAALGRQGRTPEALEHFRAALRGRADWLEPMSAVAWILATDADAAVRDPAEAVRLAERAAELASHAGASGAVLASVLDTLAAAYAAAGQFDRAVQTAESAIAAVESAGPAKAGGATSPGAAKPAAAAESAGAQALLRGIRQRLALYRQGQPYIERPPSRSGRPSPRP